MTKLQSIILFADSSRGKHIPCFFANTIEREYVKGIDPKFLDNFDDIYTDWDDWQYVLDNCKIEKDGYTYHLHHDGDLWLYCVELMTEQEKTDFFGENYND